MSIRTKALKSVPIGTKTCEEVGIFSHLLYIHWHPRCSTSQESLRKAKLHFWDTWLWSVVQHVWQHPIPAVMLMINGFLDDAGLLPSFVHDIIAGQTEVPCSTYNIGEEEFQLQRFMTTGETVHGYNGSGTTWGHSLVRTWYTMASLWVNLSVLFH